MILKNTTWTMTFKSIKIFGLVIMTNKAMRKCELNVYADEDTVVEMSKKDRPMLTKWYRQVKGLS